MTASLRVERTLQRGLNGRQGSGPGVELHAANGSYYPDQAKARRAIPVPLNCAALAVVVKQIGKHPERVFTYDGKPIERGSTSAWYRAIKRVGLKHFRYHDLRHVWASWHVQSGTPLFALQQLAGWETERMVRRYAHLSGEHLAPHAERMAENLGTFWATPGNDNKKPSDETAA